MADEIPSFEDWVDYCFTDGYADFQNWVDASAEERRAIDERGSRFAIPNPRLTEYAIRLFSDPGFIADRYSDQQIADTIWFLFGIGSEYFISFREKDVPIELQIEVVGSVGTLYTDLFDRLCNKRGAEPDGLFTNELPIDGAVAMIWDMGCIEGAAMFPEIWPHLTDPAFEVLETALFNCRTASCKDSALHGLGHLHDAQPARVEEMIDRFMALPDQPEHLRKYARQARTGDVL